MAGVRFVAGYLEGEREAGVFGKDLFFAVGGAAEEAEEFICTAFEDFGYLVAGFAWLAAGLFAGVFLLFGRKAPEEDFVSVKSGARGAFGEGYGLFTAFYTNGSSTVTSEKKNAADRLLAHGVLSGKWKEERVELSCS